MLVSPDSGIVPPIAYVAHAASLPSLSVAFKTKVWYNCGMEILRNVPLPNGHGWYYSCFICYGRAYSEHGDQASFLLDTGQAYYCLDHFAKLFPEQSLPASLLLMSARQGVK